MATSDFSNIGLYNFMFYGSFCIIFMIFVLWADDKISSPILLFVGLSYLLQVALNTAASSNKLVCDRIDPGSAIFFTLVPWLFILGVGNAALYYFPGWLRVFANSFGMWVAYNLKSEDFNISPDRVQRSPPQGEPGPTPENLERDNELKNLYHTLVIDPKKIINEVDFIGKTNQEIIDIYEHLIPINPTIFGTLHDADTTKDVVFIKELKNKEGTKNIIEEVKISRRANNIIKTIKTKNKIGFLIWNILLGLIASMISTNSLINSGCKINLL